MGNINLSRKYKAELKKNMVQRIAEEAADIDPSLVDEEGRVHITTSLDNRVNAASEDDYMNSYLQEEMQRLLLEAAKSYPNKG